MALVIYCILDGMEIEKRERRRGRKEGENVGRERRMKRREGKAVVGNFILDT